MDKGKQRATDNDNASADAASPHQDDLHQRAEAASTLASRPSPPSVCIIAIGMAGSGKTTLIHRLTSYLHGKSKPPYVLNLDPAVVNLGYEANIDIRDTVDYKEVMKQYNLGPNGGIMTALNLFTTKFDQVLDYVDRKAASGQAPYILLDTPGQIEIFTWSASGAIITDALASSMPTVVAYIIDTPRTAAPETFMSNMLYACSILYKTKLPFILVFNKTDVKDWAFAKEWMTDFEAYQSALLKKQTPDSDADRNGAFMTSLMSSMSLVLEEFYNNLRACGVSAVTGDGMEEFFERVEEARKEYEDVYKPELLEMQKERQASKDAAKQKELERALKDMNVNVPLGTSAARKGSQSKTAKTPAEMIAELEAQEREEEEDEMRDDWEPQSEDIYREDHAMYPSLRKEHERRSGITVTRARKPAIEDDEFGSRWPAPS
ncbi:hypothetical protein EMMF5_001007 [Cystobasidiomycetes sp. EMM_F5]